MRHASAAGSHCLLSVAFTHLNLKHSRCLQTAQRAQMPASLFHRPTNVVLRHSGSKILYGVLLSLFCSLRSSVIAILVLLILMLSVALLQCMSHMPPLCGLIWQQRQQVPEDQQGGLAALVLCVTEDHSTHAPADRQGNARLETAAVARLKQQVLRSPVSSCSTPA